jgi:rubredoxin
MGLEGQWECPQCEIFNYLTTKCRKCGYVISPNSCLIKGNPISKGEF